MSDTPNTPATPPPLTVAASLVAVEGLVLIGLAVLEIADVDPERWAMGSATALFFGGYGALLVVAALALWRRTAWARGPALLTQLILLGIAWNVREHVAAAVGIALVAVVAIAGVAHPDSIEALSADRD